VAGDEAAYVITFMAAAAFWRSPACWCWSSTPTPARLAAKFGWSFLITSTWDPVNDQFGALPFIYGTGSRRFLALLMGIPLGVGAAIFLAELAPPKVSDGLTF